LPTSDDRLACPSDMARPKALSFMSTVRPLLYVSSSNEPMGSRLAFHGSRTVLQIHAIVGTDITEPPLRGVRWPITIVEGDRPRGKEIARKHAPLASARQNIYNGTRDSRSGYAAI
jgi:hypothetical protein